MLIAITGCGRIGFDEPPQTAARDCWASWRSGVPELGAPERVAELDTPDVETNPSLSPDGLTLWFDRGPRANDRDLFRAERADLDAPFEAVGALAQISSPADDSRLTVDPDLTFGVMATLRDSDNYDLLFVRRATADDAFAVAADAIALNTETNQIDPELSADGLRLYYSETDGTGPHVIRVARRASLDAPFETSELVGELGPATVTADPTLSPDETVIVYTIGNLDSVDLSFATRDGVDAPFVNASVLSAASSAALDNDPELSADGCELYFSSDRSGDRAIYVSRVY